MKKISLIVFLVMAGAFIAVGLTACDGAPWNEGWKYYSASVTKMPNKVNYIEGEYFDPHGLEVTITQRNSKGEKRNDPYSPWRYNDFPDSFTFYPAYPNNKLTVDRQFVYFTLSYAPEARDLTVPITVTKP